ncbi:MAG: hypothetical protein MUQ67_10050, partial [Pirellulales bacterium]|nr:hypothetical protein [Pirellulales bacterium]
LSMKPMTATSQKHGRMDFMQLRTNTLSCSIEQFILHDRMLQSQPPTLPPRAPHYEVRFRPAILNQAGERIFKSSHVIRTNAE